MNGELREKRNGTTKPAVEILAKNGVQIDERNAEKVLDFLYFLAKLIVNQNFKK
ncbi:MAG: hypothetical protein JWQ79_979 [Mucilaginibacter sp.]|nr:hypothetical protein [Mucilaginibacter sp.]